MTSTNETSAPATPHNSFVILESSVGDEMKKVCPYFFVILEFFVGYSGLESLPEPRRIRRNNDKDDLQPSPSIGILTTTA